jgi:hypothetical protein
MKWYLLSFASLIECNYLVAVIYLQLKEAGSFTSSNRTGYAVNALADNSLCRGSLTNPQGIGNRATFLRLMETGVEFLDIHL